MANSFNFADIWARKQQDVFLKKSVSMVVADTKFNSELKFGKTFKRNYSSVTDADVPSIVTRGTDMTVRDVSDTTETLTINKEYGITIQVHDWDEIQSSYGLAMTYGEQYGQIMQAQMDADVLGEVVNATSTVDYGDVAGTAGQGIPLTVANVLNVVTAATKKLKLLNVYDTDLVAAVSPRFENIISLYYGAKVTDLGDDVSQNGYFNKISGYKLYSTNNLTCTAVLAMATNPTAGDTVTANGVTFTFVSPIGTTAGNVLIGASADATRASLATLMNAPQTTTATGVALSTTNSDRFRARVTAVNNDTANTLTVTVKGVGELTVAETFTDGTDTWTTTLKKQLNLFGVRNKCTTLITQKMPSVERTRIPLQFGDYIKNGMLYGVKTYLDNAKRMVKVEVLLD